MGVEPPFKGVAVKVTLVPAQIEPLGAAAMLTAGVTEAFIVTGVVAGAEQPAALVTVTVYVPVAAKVALEIEGFC